MITARPKFGPEKNKVTNKRAPLHLLYVYIFCALVQCAEFPLAQSRSNPMSQHSFRVTFTAEKQYNAIRL